MLGSPGCGKTTLLRRLQLEQAWAQLEAASGQTTLFVPLNAYRSLSRQAPPPEPLAWLRQEWAVQLRHAAPFDTYFQAGQLCLLLDGLNEMPHRDNDDYRDKIAIWRQFIRQTHSYGNTILFSCRSLNYSAVLSSDGLPVPHIEVNRLASDKIQTFLANHLPDQHERVWQSLQQNRRQLGLFDTPFFLHLLVEQVADQGDIPAGQAALLTGFVRRALRREIERELPLFAPDHLLTTEDRQQLIHNEWDTPHQLPDEGPLFPRLAQLAYKMQLGHVGQAGGLVRISQREAKQLLDTPLSRDIIAAAIQLNVLDKEKVREITFYHQLLQEYFAARQLAQQPEPSLAAVPWQVDDVSPSLAETIESLESSDPLPPLDATGWEETIILATAMTADPDQFVQALIDHNLPLAARCAAAPDVPISPSLSANLQQRLLERTHDDSADLRARIVAAHALAELGDPRFERHQGPYGDYLRPPMVTIPAGTYPIGDDDGYADEKPTHTVKLAAFEIGQFPVTNAEYDLFMEAGGYEDERWWQTAVAQAWRRGEGSSEGQKQNARDLYQLLQTVSDEQIRSGSFTSEQIEQYLWLKTLSLEALEKQLEETFPAGVKHRQPEYWTDGRFNHPAHPVVGITWFEARAYCAWLSAQTGHTYTLPTEVQWEAAARGPAGPRYPYGNTFDVANSNTFESHIRATTPIGIYKNGRTPTGIYDLSGNVWEWTSTLWGTDLNTPDYPYPYRPDDGREDEENGLARRVVRGGSWGNGAYDARAAYRGPLPPYDRNNVLGFRLARVAAS